MPLKISSPLRALAAAAFAASLAFAHPALAQSSDGGLQTIPGTTVSLVPIEGWTVANGFSGLANEQSQASLVVVELPGEAAAQIAPLFTDIETAKAAFAGQGVEVSGLSKLATDAGSEIPVVTGSQDANGVTYDKWIALLAGTNTVMLTVQSPREAGLDNATVEAMLKSVVLADKVSLDEKIAALPFSIEAAEPFRVLDTIAGSGVLMTGGPEDVDPEGRQPLLVAVMQISQPLAADQQEEVAKALLVQTKSLEQAEVDGTQNVPFAGGEGILLSGTAREGDIVRRFVQYLRIGEEGRFIRLIATAEETQFETVRPAVEKIAASIDFRN